MFMQPACTVTMSVTDLLLVLHTGEFPENKLYKIFPVLKECVYLVLGKTEKKKLWWPDCTLAILFLLIPFYWRVSLEPPMCIGCDNRLTIEHILLTCSDFIEIRERATLQLNHCACCLRIFHLKRFLTFWKNWLIFLERKKIEIVFSYVYVFTL